jgi:hypothetical protein
MQKIFNAIAVASGVVSLTVVGATITAYVMRDAIIQTIQDKALETVTGGFKDALPIPDATGSVIPELPTPMF